MNARTRTEGTDLLFFKLGAQEGWVVNEKAQLLHSWERAQVPIVQDAGWTLGWFGQVYKISPVLGFNPWTVQLVACHYSD